MHYEVVLIPALAGYWFLTQINLFVEPFEGKANQQIILETGLCGAFLLTVSWILVRLLEECIGTETILQISNAMWGSSAAPGTVPVLMLTVLLALVCPVFVNVKVSKIEADTRWALLKETARGRVLRKSYEEVILSEIIMDNGRSYIGFPVAHHETLSYEGDVTFIPYYYGHRDQTTNQLIITNNFNQNDDEERVVLQLDKILTTSLFFAENNNIIWYDQHDVGDAG